MRNGVNVELTANQKRYLKNPDYYKKRAKKYRENNRERCLAMQKNYNDLHKREHKEYLKNHPEKVKQYRETTRARYPWMVSYYKIMERCNKPNNDNYKYYGGRGIRAKITSEEVKFLWFRDEAFLLKKPTIDRIDNDGDYEISNCRFIEHSENTARAHRKNNSLGGV